MRDGVVVGAATPTVPTPDDARGVRADTIYVHPDAEMLRQLVAQVDRGQLQVDVARLPGTVIATPSAS